MNSTIPEKNITLHALKAAVDAAVALEESGQLKIASEKDFLELQNQFPGCLGRIRHFVIYSTDVWENPKPEYLLFQDKLDEPACSL